MWKLAKTLKNKKLYFSGLKVPLPSDIKMWVALRL